MYRIAHFNFTFWNLGKKKVHYRNTPTYLSSREHTKHEPMEEGILKVPPDQRTNSVLMRYQVNYIQRI